MILKDRNDREVEVELEGGAFEEPFISSAVYVDTGEDASDEVCEYLLNSYDETISQELFEKDCSDAYDMFKDRDYE